MRFPFVEAVGGGGGIFQKKLVASHAIFIRSLYLDWKLETTVDFLRYLITRLRNLYNQSSSIWTNQVSSNYLHFCEGSSFWLLFFRVGGGGSPINSSIILLGLIWKSCARGVGLHNQVLLDFALLRHSCYQESVIWHQWSPSVGPSPSRHVVVSSYQLQLVWSGLEATNIKALRHYMAENWTQFGLTSTSLWGNALRLLISRLVSSFLPSSYPTSAQATIPNDLSAGKKREPHYGNVSERSQMRMRTRKKYSSLFEEFTFISPFPVVATLLVVVILILAPQISIISTSRGEDWIGKKRNCTAAKRRNKNVLSPS